MKIEVTLDLSILAHQKMARKLGYKVPFNKRRNLYGTKEQLDAVLDKSGECWMWTKSTNRDGYGCFKYERKTKMAHRVMYEFCKGPIPAGKVVMHSCDNPGCCNPDHLSVGTHAENKMDSVMKDRHCYGERSPKAKLTADQVRRILAEGRSKHGMQRKLAREFGIHYSTVNVILSKRNWNHIA